MDIDYNFVAAGAVAQVYHGFSERLRTEAFKPIANNFEGNLDRVISHALTTIQLMFFAGLSAKLTCQARMECGQDPDDDASDLHPDVIAATKRLTERFNERALADPLAFGALIMDETGNAMPRFLNTFPHLAPGIEATLAAMIMDAWMAFEVLAGDLWKAAVNAYPEELAANCIKAQAFRSSEEPAPQEKSIALSMVQRHKFDLTHVMGDVLASSNKVRLNSFKGTEHAYQSAFGDAWDDSNSRQRRTFFFGGLSKSLRASRRQNRCSFHQAS